MKAEIKQVDGLSLMGRASSNHSLVMDAFEDVGGNGAATKPMELILLGLGGCTGMDVISILKKKRVPFKNINIKIEAERAETHPQVFTKIYIKFLIFGHKEKINTRDVERAIELSKTKYCSASAMLKKVADIVYNYEILEIST